MAKVVIHSESWLAYGASTTQADLSPMYSTVPTSAMSFQTMGSGKCIRMDGIAGHPSVIYTLPSAQTRIKTGVFWRIDGFGAFIDPPRIFEFYDGATLQAYLYFADTTHIELFRGDGTSQGTFTIPTIAINTAYHVEVDITFNDSTGSCELWFNGISKGTLSSKDTNNGGGNQITKVGIGKTANVFTSVQDFGTWEIQTSGGDFPLGQAYGELLIPNGDASHAWATDAGAGGATNYQHYDNTPVSTAAYVYSNVSGAQEGATIPDLAATSGTVAAVVWRGQGKLDVSGAKTFKPYVKIGGVTYYGTTQSPTTTHSGFEYAWNVDPSTGVAWTIAGVNAIQELGAEII